MKKVKQINIVFLSTVLIYILASLFLSNWSERLSIGTVLRIILSQGLLCLPMVVYLLASKESLGQSLRLNRIKVGTVFLVILFALLMVPLMGFLNGLSMMFTQNTIGSTMSSMPKQYPYWLSLIVLALIPCILEEMVYRGVFFNEYRKLNRRWGILLSALLFGLMHMNLNQFIYAFVMGIIFAMMVEVTNSLLSSMIMHFTFNALSTSLVYLLEHMRNILGDRIPGFEESASNLNSSIGWIVIILYGIMAAVGLLLGAVVLYGIAKNENRKDELLDLVKINHKDEISSAAHHLVSIPLMIGILICIILIVRFQLIG